MKTLKQFALVAMAVAVAATPALAGTKYAANLVPNSATDPVLPPTVGVKSSIKMDDKGKIQVSLAGVVEPGPGSVCYGGGNDGAVCTNPTECPSGVCGPEGVPVTTSGAYANSGSIDDTTYMAIIKLRLPAVEGLFPIIELPVPIDLKSGKGKTKYSASALFGFIPLGAGRTVEITGVEVWGPLGMGNEAACLATLSNPIPVLFPPDPACRGGSEIGMSGMAIPAP